MDMTVYAAVLAWTKYADVYKKKDHATGRTQTLKLADRSDAVKREKRRQDPPESQSGAQHSTTTMWGYAYLVNHVRPRDRAILENF